MQGKVRLFPYVGRPKWDIKLTRKEIIYVAAYRKYACMHNGAEFIGSRKT